MDAPPGVGGPGNGPPAPQWTGKQLGRYAVTDLLGRGGTGEVYAAVDADLNRQVAIKTLSPEYGDNRSVEGLIREAKAASALNHPNILTVHEVLRIGSTVAIVMEKVEGDSVRARCAAPMAVTEAVRIGRQTAQALASAHAAGLIHRDIKPENIMVRADGIVKVVDFGLARQDGVGPHSAPGMTIGTLRYLSPEQAMGEPATAASDVFALGMVMHEALTGRHPFDSESMFDVLHGIGTRPATRLSGAVKDCPPELDALIARMLSKDPAQRPQSSTVAAELAKIEGRLVHGTGRRAPWLWVAAVLALVVVGALWWNRLGKMAANPELRRLTTTDAENRVTAAAISPDGKLLVYADVTGAIQLRSIETNVTRPLRGPGNLLAERIAWFRDQTKLMVTARSAMPGDLSVWEVPVDGGAPRMLRPQAQDGTPSPDGRRFVFTSVDGHEVWVGDLTGASEPRRLLAGDAMVTFPLAVWSPDGKRLICQKLRYAPRPNPRPESSSMTLDQDYHRTYESIDAETGSVTASGNVAMTSAVAIEDGRILFLWIDKTGPFSLNFWEVDTDPRTGTLRGEPRQITRYVELAFDNMSASADGARVVAVHSESQPDIYVADAVVGGALRKRRLTLDQKGDYPHAWSKDGQTVYFESNRNGSWDIFRQRVAERNAELMAGTAREEFNPVLSPDEKWILFLSGAAGASASDWKLQRVPVEGGEPVTIPLGDTVMDYFDCAQPGGKRCVLRTTENREYVFYELDAVKGKGRLLARVPWSPGVMGDWALSASGAFVAIPNHDVAERLIRVVSLENGTIAPIRLDASLAGIIGGVHAGADDKSWLVSLRREVEFFRSVAKLRVDIAQVGADGKGTVLHESPITTWGILSPGGRRLAFVDGTMMGNVVLVQR